MRIIGLFVMLFLFPSMAFAQHIVTPGPFTISLGDYSDWTDRAAESNCADLGVNCDIDSDEYRVVGDNSSNASSAEELSDLCQTFGFECLDKAAVFADQGQYVYPDVGQPNDPLHNHFVSEANRCWNFYDNIYKNNKDKY